MGEGSSLLLKARVITKIKASGPQLALYAACALIPVIILTICLALVGEYPFGNVRLLGSDYDLACQYANLLSWFQNVLLGDANLLYSQGKSLGGSMFVTYSYYVASPLNLLVAFFPQGDIEDFYFFVRLLRTALCGITIALFLSKRLTSLSRPLILVLAICYALNQYNLVQATNIMWLDAPILIPLVALGVYHFVESGRLRLFVVAMVISIVSCWYTGYMMVLASVFMFVLEHFLKAHAEGGFSWRAFGAKLFKFCLILLLVAAAAAVILLPSVYGLFSGKGSSHETASGIIRCKPWEFFTAVLPMSFKYNWEGPQFFCGTLTLAGVLLLLVTRNVTRQQKMLFVLVLFALLLCMFASPLDRVWTGFTDANNYYCRWAFVFEFFILFAAAFALSKGLPERRDVLCVLACLLALGIIGLMLGGFSALEANVAAALRNGGLEQSELVKTSFSVFSARLCFAMFIVVCVVLFCSWALAKRGVNYANKLTKLAAVLLVCAVVMDVGINAFSTVAANVGLKVCAGQYNQYTTSASQSLCALKKDDSDLYRVEKTYSHLQDRTRLLVPTSEGLALGYMPLTSYLSTNDTPVSRFMGNMGYMARQTDSESVYQGTFSAAILPSDSLLGLRYVGSSDTVQGYENTGKSSGGEGHIWYKNNDAFPLAFGVGASATHAIDAESDAFSYQNKVFQVLFGIDAQMYTPLSSTKITSNETGVNWVVDEASSSDLCYLEVRSKKDYSKYYWSGFTLSVNGTPLPGGYYSAFTYGVVSVGTVFTGEEVSLSGSADLGQDEDMALYVVEVNKPLLDSLSAEAWSKAATFNEFRDGYISATYTASDNDTYLFMSVPYDDGWTVVVNGEVVQPETVADCLMAIPVLPGENQIELSYCSPMFKEGAAVSVLAWVGMLGFMLVRAIRKTT